MTLDQAAYNLLNILRGGRSTNNEYYSLEQIKFNIEYYRALFIRRDADTAKRRSRLYDLEQDLGQVPVEVIDPAEGGLATFQGYLLRTTDDIPKPVRLREHSGITYVGRPDRRVAYPIIEFQEVRWQKFNKFTSGKPRSFLLNDRIHVIGVDLVEQLNSLVDGDITFSEITDDAFKNFSQFVTIRGIFEHPREAFELANPGEEFDDSEDPYPLPMDMLQRINQSLLSGEFQILLQTPTDIEADQLPDQQTPQES